MAVIIPNVVNWSVTPQNGQEDYFTKMNIWLSESTNVIASLSTAITKINESNTESNDNLEEVLIARDQTVAARNEAVTAVATLTAGAIDDTTIAPNKAFSNQFITNNYYKKTDTYNKTEIDNKININGFTEKITPVDTDHIGIQETGGVFKKLSFANLKTWIGTFFVSKPELITITGMATFNGTTQTIDLTGVGNITLAIGDVIQVNSPLNNKLHTVESIPNANQIIVNYEHRGTSTPVPKGRLTNETAIATITLYNRAKNAPLGQGQYWCTPATTRSSGVTVPNNTGRELQISLVNGATAGNNGIVNIYEDGNIISSFDASGNANVSSNTTMTISPSSTYAYSVAVNPSTVKLREKR